MTDEIQAPPQIPEISEETKNTPKGVWKLTPSLWVKQVNPSDFYETSGEAIEKAEALIKELQQQLCGAKNLHRVLVQARGQNKYLESERDHNEVILKIKNPRTGDLKPRKPLSDITKLIGYGDKVYCKESKTLTTYCVINADEETYSYFNCGEEFPKLDEIKFVKLKLPVKDFEQKLKSNNYKKVLI